MKSLFIYMVLLLLPAMLIAQPKPAIAVIDSNITHNIDSSAVIPVTYRIMTELVQSNQFTVLERANVEQIVEEYNFQFSGVVSEEQIKKLGSALGAQFIVLSDISKVGNTYSINSRMVDVESLQIVKAVSESRTGEIDELLSMAQLVGRRLVSDETEDLMITGTQERSGSSPGSEDRALSIGLSLRPNHYRPFKNTGLAALIGGAALLTFGIIEYEVIIFDSEIPGLLCMVVGGIGMITGPILMLFQSPQSNIALSMGPNRITLTAAF